MTRPSLAWLLLGASLTLSACSSGMSDLEQWVASVKARKNTQIEPIPQIKQYEAFAYVAGDRRDPFVPTQPEHDRGPSNNLRPDLNRNKEALEEFPLDALKLVGLVNYENRIYGMVKAPDGVIHRVTIGNHMGQNFGTITKITEGEITLNEIVADGFGGFTERLATLAAE
jgi:type IV pilus assembly protein PilP